MVRVLKTTKTTKPTPRGRRPMRRVTTAGQTWAKTKGSSARRTAAAQKRALGVPPVVTKVSKDELRA